NQFIQRLQLKKASYQLAFQPDEKIINIALDAGFENHESFSRAFKKTYEVTPLQFRKQPNWLNWNQQHQYHLPKETKAMDVKISHFPTTLVAVVEHQGNPKLLNQTITQFIQWRKSCDESPVTQAETFGIAYSDPATTPMDQFQFDVCASITKPVRKNHFGVVTKTIPGGRCAHLIHRGSHDLMDAKIKYLYEQWLIKNNEKLRDFPCFFKYHNLFPQVSEHDLVTDIYLPLTH
ncbi:MAG: AraC family transcriptional regulator, partial [Marinicella sp.]